MKRYGKYGNWLIIWQTPISREVATAAAVVADRGTYKAREEKAEEEEEVADLLLIVFQ
jgi:hypothetical protein